MSDMDRRSFLGRFAAATVLLSRLSRAATGDRKSEPIGVQLYSVRGEMEKDFEGTLAKVAAIGYREVEFAGLFHHSPRQVRAILDRDGLIAVSSHVDYQVLGTDWQRTVEGAKTMGQNFIVCPFLPEKLRNPEGLKQLAETFNRAGEESKKAGIQFGYHNHNFEFKTSVG